MNKKLNEIESEIEKLKNKRVQLLRDFIANEHSTGVLDVLNKVGYSLSKNVKYCVFRFCIEEDMPIYGKWVDIVCLDSNFKKVDDIYIGNPFEREFYLDINEEIYNMLKDKGIEYITNPWSKLICKLKLK